MDTYRSFVSEIDQVFTGEHMDLSLIDTPNRCIHSEHGNIGHLHDRVNHLRNRRMVHLPSYFIHAPCCPIQGNLLGELEHKQFIVPVQLKIGSQHISHVLQAKPFKTTPVVIGEFSDFFHRSFTVEERMEISQQDDDFKTSGLEIHKFVYGDEMAEMYLATGFVSCIDFFLRLGEKCAEVVFCDNFNSISGYPLVRIH